MRPASPCRPTNQPIRPELSRIPRAASEDLETPMHPVAVFGRVGSRPFNLEEMKRLYLAPDGEPWTVVDDPAEGAPASGR